MVNSMDSVSVVQGTLRDETLIRCLPSLGEAPSSYTILDPKSLLVVVVTPFMCDAASHQIACDLFPTNPPRCCLPTLS